MAEGVLAKRRSKIIRSCWLGNSIINNLQEPAIQLDELKKDLPFLQDCLEQEMLSPIEKKLIVEEIGRQIEFMNEFQIKLNTVVEEMHSAARGKRGAV